MPDKSVLRLNGCEELPHGDEVGTPAVMKSKRTELVTPGFEQQCMCAPVGLPVNPDQVSVTLSVFNTSSKTAVMKPVAVELLGELSFRPESVLSNVTIAAPAGALANPMARQAMLKRL